MSDLLNKSAVAVRYNAHELHTVLEAVRLATGTPQAQSYDAFFRGLAAEERGTVRQVLAAAGIHADIGPDIENVRRWARGSPRSTRRLRRSSSLTTGGVGRRPGGQVTIDAPTYARVRPPLRMRITSVCSKHAGCPVARTTLAMSAVSVSLVMTTISRRQGMTILPRCGRRRGRREHQTRRSGQRKSSTRSWTRARLRAKDADGLIRRRPRRCGRWTRSTAQQQRDSVQADASGAARAARRPGG